MKKVENNAQAQAIVEDLAKGLGFSIWWQFNSCYVTPDELRTMVAAAGGDDTKISNIDPSTALKAAVREFRTRKGKKTVAQAEVVSEDGAYIKVGLLYHERISDDEVAKKQRETLLWDKHARVWIDGNNTPHSDALRAKVAHKQRFYDGNEVRERIVMPAIRNACGFSIKKGWYFIPSDFEEEIANAQVALEGLESFQLHCASIPKGHGWEAPVAAGASESLGDELGAISDQVEGWLEMSRRVRSDTVENVMTRFGDIMKRASLMEAALSVSLGDLHDRVKEMKARANEVIDLKEAEVNERYAPTPMNIRDTLASLEPGKARESFVAIVGKAPPEDREEMLDALASHMEGLQVA